MAPTPAHADVIEIGADGAITRVNGPVIVNDAGAAPIAAPRPTHPRLAPLAPRFVAAGGEAQLSPRLLEAVNAVPRVLDQPGKRSAVYLSNFLADGLELTVSYWIGDPANGQANVRSGVNEAILRVLRESGYKLAVPSVAAGQPA